MRSIPMPALTACGALLLVATASAAPVSSLKIPPGARVSVSGTTVAMRANGTTGTYSCRCDAGSGSCSIKQSPGVLSCEASSGSACTSCVMETTTNPKSTAINAGAVTSRSMTTH